MADLGYEKLTVAASAVGLASIPTGATMAYIQCRSNPVRVRADGTTVDATNGLTILAEGDMYLRGAATLANASFIRTGSDATLDVHYGTLNEGVWGTENAV